MQQATFDVFSETLSPAKVLTAKKTKKSSKKTKLSQSRSKPKKKGPAHPLFLGYDLGGTKVAVGVVDSDGHLLHAYREPVLLKDGKEATLKQLIRLGSQLIKDFPTIARVGIASAGPLDPVNGILLDPTNFKSSEGTWGIVPITEIFSKALKRPVSLENDAAAAMLAEKWKGHAKDVENAMILTLGTGLGTGIFVNGELVRAGRHTHTEAGHMIIKANDSSAPCGCGNFGCAEAYLSGKSFTYRGREFLGNPSIDAPQIAARARRGDAQALAMFAEYSEMLALTLHNYAMIYAPEVVILTGSFAAASDMFLENTYVHLRKLLERRLVSADILPRIEVSTLENQAGVLGGAYVAFLAHEKNAKAHAKKLHA